MKYRIANWCSNCNKFTKIKTIEMADCNGYQCVKCFDIISSFKLPKYKIDKNIAKLKQILGKRT